MAPGPLLLLSLLVPAALGVPAPRQGTPQVQSSSEGWTCGGTEAQAQSWTDLYNARAQEVWPISTEASWKYNTDITQENLDESLAQSTIRAAFDEEAADCARLWNFNSFSDQYLKREMGKIAEKGSTALDDNDYNELNQVTSDMQSTYSTAKVCNKPGDSSGQCYPLDPDLSQILATSRDWDELVWAWDGWRNVSGRQMPHQYERMVELLNKAAEINGYEDNGDYWRSWYEDPNFRDLCENLWLQLKPLYQQLHAFVRRRLQAAYPGHTFPEGGFIPAHITGNMWAQSWTNIEDLVRPFPEEQGVDVSDEMKSQGMTAYDMFEMSEDFFDSLGLEKMPPLFWMKSMIEKPPDKDVVCHASAWDFYNQKDFRIKQCTDITMNWLITTHHEMGHVEYYLQYKHLPVKFRRGGNPGFHEAIGDVMSLSVSTPTHLKQVGLLPDFVDKSDCAAPKTGGGGLCQHKCFGDNDCSFGQKCCSNGCGTLCAAPEPSDVDINFLMNQALKKIAFIPFGYLIDQWRWDIFDGSVPKSQYNTKWWENRCRYQGIAPPNSRFDTDFDGGAKFHVPSNVAYIRYFISHVLQFQFQKSLCDAAGWKGDLFKCDIYNSKDAGKLIGDMMKLGSSVHWEDALEAITGSRQMSSEPLVEYFQPLLDWLAKENEGHPIGWNETKCPDGTIVTSAETDARAFAELYDTEAEAEYFNVVTASWAYNTNLTSHNMEVSLNASARAATWSKEMALTTRTYDYENFIDPDLNRQMTMMADMGTAVLEDADYAEMSTLQAQMTQTYSTAKVCNKPGDLNGPTTCYPLDPDLTNIMASSEDWDELVWAWEGWRNESGKKMPDDYEAFVGLQNKAATMNGYDDNGEYWRSWYEDDAFRQVCEDLWNEVLPFYKELHAFVRFRLQQRYPNNQFPDEGHIPAHILGNMWAQSWQNIESLVRPDNTVSGVDVTEELLKQNKTELDLFHISDEFFTSLGLLPMPQPFWDHSMIVKPEDRDVVCHASAWDFYNKVDFRIKQCTEVNTNWLYVTHHEMGHVQYFLQYKDQPVVYRGGANPGFHEAIGDVMELSVSTPGHLNQIGLFPTYNSNAGIDLNFLMDSALKKIAFLPFGYLIDQWRWDVFDNTTTKDDYNKHWWDMRCKYQGVSPPTVRTNTDFDPGAKFHVPNNTPYIRYFVSHILQFQFHKALCDAAGWTGPLHRCDIYQSQEAGKLIGDMMRLGASKPWPDALEAMTGSRTMSAESITEYYRPLMNWMSEEMANNNITATGWTDACPTGTIQL